MIRIKKVTIDNYRGIEHDEFEINDRGIVFGGSNGIGKTSRIEAIYWALTGVLFDNSSKGITDKIKTLKNGKKPPLSVSLEIIGEYDEKFYITKEVQERWVNKKASDEEIYDGDETSYYVNGVKKIKRDYDLVIDRIFGLERIKQEIQQDDKIEQLKKIDMFNLLTNYQYFRKLDKKTQRELLIFTVGDIDIRTFEMSESTREYLGTMTFDDAKKKLKNQIKEFERDVELSSVKLSTLKKDIGTLTCPHCGKTFEIDEAVIGSIEVERHDAVRARIKLENIFAEIEMLETSYLKALDRKVRTVFDEVAHIEIIDDNLNPTVKILFKDSSGNYVDVDNGINTGNGILSMATFLAFLKMILIVPSSIMFFDSLETLDDYNMKQLSQIDEQIFGTQVIRKQTRISKTFVDNIDNKVKKTSEKIGDKI